MINHAKWLLHANHKNKNHTEFRILQDKSNGEPAQAADSPLLKVVCTESIKRGMN